MARPKGLPKTGGKPKGYKAPQTLAKEQAREIARQRITERLLPIIDAQCDSAEGIKHFMVRDPGTGQWARLTSHAKIAAALNDPRAKAGSTYWIYTKDPNPLSAKDMLAYAIDKPKDQKAEIEISGDDVLIAALLAGRARAAERAKGKK